MKTTEPNANVHALDPEAITVALAVAPGVYSRNRFFALFESKAMKAARKRAGLVRGILKQWSEARRVGESAFVIRFEPLEPNAASVRVHYEAAHLALRCTVELSAVECACLRYLASRGTPPLCAESDADRDCVLASLAKLHPTFHS
jgi:hypothetical protein